MTWRPAVSAAPTEGSTVIVPTVFAGPGGQKVHWREKESWPALEIGQRRHVFARGHVHDADVVEEDIAGGMAEAEMQGAVVRRIVLRDELEFDQTPGRLDSDGAGTGATEEHTRPDRLAVHQ